MLTASEQDRGSHVEALNAARPASGAAGESAARRYPIGAEVVEGGVHFRVWAPGHERVAVVIADGIEQLAATPLTDQGDGYFSVTVPGASAGTLYWFRLGDDETLCSDPASRFQPEGPLGPSQVIDPRFSWTDADWRGASLEGQVIYEMHIGTFTPGGTWRSAIEELDVRNR
mgnify:CR=1 FL=1